MISTGTFNQCREDIQDYAHPIEIPIWSHEGYRFFFFFKGLGPFQVPVTSKSGKNKKSHSGLFDLGIRSRRENLFGMDSI